MSEYQYYEFQAIDRPLTETEMEQLRSYSTRARITTTNFMVEYSYGDFKGDADAWMEKYFDVFLHFANWGTHILKFRLPSRLLDADTAQFYCGGECLSARASKGWVILTFLSQDEDGEAWADGEPELSSLISIRAELARGDLRGLYLGWLLDLQEGNLDNEEFEPPVPDGLDQLSSSLESLVEFLRIDPFLIEAAAIASLPLADAGPKPEEVRAWLETVPAAEKDDFLTRAVAGDAALANELVQRMKRESGSDRGAGKGTSKRRTVEELLRSAEHASNESRRLEAEKALRRTKEAAAARARHLRSLAGKETALWKEVEDMIATKQQDRYDAAVTLLVDLRDLAALDGRSDFLVQLESLRGRHKSKSALIGRLLKAGL